MKPLFFCLAIITLIAGHGFAYADPISAPARALIASIDALNVEQRWPAGEHVHWESGEPDGKPEKTPGKHTHCSAFVAAAAKKVGIYILRPPEHGQILLANAQFDWLENQGARQGWLPVRDAVEAQAHANRGDLVVAAYKNHHDDKPGHIAIVRPSDKSAMAIRAEGPEITQAGGTNYRDTTLQRGFAGHPAAWAQHEVRFYAHVVK
ncbi:hypothetical protein ELE36_02790 [Pseudolysobacter antarcticus]|uniref:CHAP domain-containing protein n=1 Tax=Pseudolysobacter antarcticus TaxID=2511995 RepID=A0A411HG13_9GAMM|nr:hypothetical protein [Pseudolysobacter antarcticus]QBB69387.1 hypothetical protein ELE36_02790 [Pseudolysobacter antarcticus]